MRTVAALLLLACLLLLRQPLSAAETATDDETTTTGYLTLATDNIWRGVSQTQHGPMVQAYLEYEAKSGFYVAVTGANVSSSLYVNQGSAELDLVVGHRGSLRGGVTYDASLTNSFYPGASTPTAGPQKYDTSEFILVLTKRRFDVTLATTLTDWFGVNSAAPYNLSGDPAGDSQWSTYVAAAGHVELGKDLELVLGVGRMNLRNYGDANCTDYRAALTKTLGDFDIGLAWTRTNGIDELYVVEGENLGESTVFFSVTRNF